MFRRLFVTLAAILVICSAPATAENYRLDFKASEFTGTFGEISFSPITGSFSFAYDSFGTTDPVIFAVDLVVDGHTYTVPEVSTYATRSLFSFSGTEQLMSGTNSFQMFYTSGFVSFGFTSAVREGLWFAGTVDAELALLPAVVPEPETALLLLGGLAIVGCAARRRRHAAPQSTPLSGAAIARSVQGIKMYGEELATPLWRFCQTL